YLVPDKGAAKAYGLLLEAMKKTQRAAVARMVMRSKQYLCAMRPMDKGLVLSTLLYGDEVVPQSEFEELEPAEFKPQPRELEMAQQLVESLAGHFDVTQYKDEHRERLLAMIEAKAEGQQVVEAPEAEEERPKVVNLMDALKRSLEASSKDAAKGERRHRPEAARTAAPKKAPSRKRKSA
ncbi:MAG TPA: Ku protein, partial [Myxococcaceae bacterium]|nr:Ku protein [Myxococcaceae bacterium]